MKFSAAAALTQISWAVLLGVEIALKGSKEYQEVWHALKIDPIHPSLNVAYSVVVGCAIASVCMCDLMNVLLNFEKSLSLEGKKEKAEALYGILPIVLNILQQALRKAKLNEEIDGLLMIEEIWNLVDNPKGMDCLNSCADNIIPFMQLIVSRNTEDDKFRKDSLQNMVTDQAIRAQASFASQQSSSQLFKDKHEYISLTMPNVSKQVSS
ncbi:unnamed protein product [Dracunculus medinensis]|uniref:Tetratricopeptide repeat (TPR)-like superfamily protein n=1 Tax=Dracunculus medinensis TaxID=318479 RepID=A0A0N4UE56_DRAME|nr:unnamed protein product [Dracunculus medinensis]